MDFIILKVNGIDVSNSSHDDVISILNKAKQPVQVEVLTKEEDEIKTNQQSISKPINSINNQLNQNDLNKKSPIKIDKQTQTDSKWLDNLIYDYCLKHQIDLNQQNLELKQKNNDFYEILDDSDNYLDDELEADFIDENCDAFEYKELNWSKTNPNDSISLIIDKLNNDDKSNLILKNEIVYVKEILNASLQNLIKPGDQLLEINGIKVTNLEDTKQKLNNPMINEFNILFSRLNDDHDHRICEQRIKLRKEKVIWLKQNALRNMNQINLNRNNELINNLPNHSMNLEENDSGLGKQSTDQESLYTRTNETCSSNDYDVFHNSPIEKINELSTKKSSSTNSLEKEILLLNKEMENIKFECESLKNKFNNQKIDKNSSHLKGAIKLNDNQSINKTKQITRQLSDLSNNISFSNQSSIDNKQIEKKESIKKWIKNGLDNRNLKYNIQSNVKFNDLNNKIDELLNRFNKKIINTVNNNLSTSQTSDNLLTKRSGSMISLKSIDYQNNFKQQQFNNLDTCTSEHEYAVINYENTSLLKQNNNFKNLINKTNQPPPLPNNHPIKTIKNTISNKFNSSIEDNEIKMATSLMYTNKANLHQTILLQQQLLRNSIEKKNANLLIDNNNLIINDTNKCKKIDKNKFLLDNTIIKLKRKADGTRYISRKNLINDTNEFFKQQKIINCNKNLLNNHQFEFNNEQKSKKSKENDSKHLIMNHKFLNGLKNKSNDKFKKIKLKDDNNSIVVATV